MNQNHSSDDNNRFTTITEISGEPAPKEQISRLEERYHWAAEICKDKDVVELACGAGPGLGLLQKVSKSFVAGDISEKLVDHCKSVYGDRVDVQILDAMKLPFKAKSKDVILIFEALYYLPDAKAFFAEVNRVLRPGGKLLIVSANKDLYDFNPSPFSVRYYGTRELKALADETGFETRLYGGTPVGDVSIRQRVLRPIKKIAVDYNLMPKTMKGKELLKRIVFGEMEKLPKEIAYGHSHLGHLTVISPYEADEAHKVLYFEGTKTNA